MSNRVLKMWNIVGSCAEFDFDYGFPCLVVVLRFFGCLPTIANKVTRWNKANIVLASWLKWNTQLGFQSYSGAVYVFGEAVVAVSTTAIFFCGSLIGEDGLSIFGPIHEPLHS